MLTVGPWQTLFKIFERLIFKNYLNPVECTFCLMHRLNECGLVA